MARAARARSWSTRRVELRLDDEDWERLERLGEGHARWRRGPFGGERWILWEVVGPALQAYESLVAEGRVDREAFKRWLANVGREEPEEGRAQFLDAMADLTDALETTKQATGAVERAAAEDLVRDRRGLHVSPVASFDDRQK